MTDPKTAHERAVEAAAKEWVEDDFGEGAPVDETDIIQTSIAINAYLAALEREGWQLVPKEATDDMLTAALGYQARRSFNGERWLQARGLAVEYKHMLAAAPSAQEGDAS